MRSLVCRIRGHDLCVADTAGYPPVIGRGSRGGTTERWRLVRMAPSILLLGRASLNRKHGGGFGLISAQIARRERSPCT